MSGRIPAASRWITRWLVLAIGLTVGGCGLIDADVVATCGWSEERLAFEGRTTLAAAGLEVSGDVVPNEEGHLVVTADPVELPGGAPDFSAPPSERPSARMYCFHPDGSDAYFRGVVADDWAPPGS